MAILTEAQLREAAAAHHRTIKAELPRGVGYLSFLYNPATGHVVYTSSMPRHVVLKMLRSWLDAQAREGGAES
jgi:hypothetical protein